MEMKSESSHQSRTAQLSGIVTAVNSNSNISVDGMTCHNLDVCRVVTSSDDDSGEEEENEVSS